MKFSLAFNPKRAKVAALMKKLFAYYEATARGFTVEFYVGGCWRATSVCETRDKEQLYTFCEREASTELGLRLEAVIDGLPKMAVAA